MGKSLIAVILMVLLAGSGAALSAPQDTPARTATIQAQEAEKAPELGLQAKEPLYNPTGRRDPFRDLMGGRAETGERPAGEGADLSITDLNLVGLFKVKGKWWAIINGPQGFPYKIKEGDKFSDGYVLKVTDTGVTFRVTSEKGLRLPKPRDVVKEIYPEER